MKSVDFENCSASRNTLLLRAPHKPRSAAIRMTALLRISRASSKGWLSSAIRIVVSRCMRYNRRTKGRPATAASCALRILDAATICIALVIRAVLSTDRIWRRRSRVLCIIDTPKLRCRAHRHVFWKVSAAAFNSSVNGAVSAFSCAIF